ncbi:MAG: CBS domain-containing protein [Chloroflexota bacterium]
MEQQPRDESRAATVRTGGSESWTEAGELIDRPTNLPTAAGSREPDGEVPPGGGEAATGHTSTGRSAPVTTTRRTTGPSASHVETRSPGGADFSSSAAPAGVGSNTPVGGEPEGFRAWDARQDEPGTGASGGMMGMMGMPSMSALGGLAASAAIGGLTYAWWRRRQARQTRAARMRELLTSLGATFGTSASGELPRMVGQAAAQSRSAWLPLLLLPVALWLRERGKDGERASEQLLEPLDLDRRSERLARQGTDLLEAYRRRLVGDLDPNARRGWPMPWPLIGAVAGLGIVGYRRGWFSSAMSSSMMSGMGGTSRTMVRDVMTRRVETTAPDTTIADVARRMRDLDVGSLPVTDGNRLLGIVTDRDLSVRATAASKDPNTTRVREVMSPELAWIFDDEPADAAARVMRERQIRRLPVLDRGDRLVGVVALADLATDLGDDRLKGATLEEISQPSGAGSR